MKGFLVIAALVVVVLGAVVAFVPLGWLAFVLGLVLATLLLALAIRYHGRLLIALETVRGWFRRAPPNSPVQSPDAPKLPPPAP